MSDPFTEAARNVPGPEEQERQGDLVQAQAFAAERPPERSAQLLKKARAAGMSLELIEAEAGKDPAIDWREMTRGLPVTRDTLADPERAAAMQDDVGALAAIERLFLKGMSETAWETKTAWQRGRINQRVADIGYRQMQGTATPEEVAEADRLEAQGALIPRPPLGLVPRGIRAAVESAPLMLQSFAGSAEQIGTWGVSGALAGATTGGLATAPAGGVGAVPGAIAGLLGGAGWGSRLGMMREVGKQEGGLAYREYMQIQGVTHEQAKLAATFVGIANGFLEVAPLEVVLQIPGLKGLVGRTGVRDVFRQVLKSNTGRAVVARAAARMAEGMTLEGLTEAAQELSTILGGQFAKGGLEMLSLRDVDWSRVGQAGLEGALAGGVMGGPGLAAGVTAESLEVRRTQARADFFTALGETTAGSKTFERLPDEAKAFVARAQERHGGPVEAVSVPAEKLQTLFQKNDIMLDQVAARMPGVARQLEEAGGNPGVEVTIPIGDFAANVARLPGYEGLVEDLRVGDDLTLREAKAAEAEAKELAAKEAKRERTAQETVTPAQRVLQDVAGKLEAVGMDPESARTNAALWAAFSNVMSKRTGKGDAWAFYEGLKLDVRSSEVTKAPEGALAQASPAGVEVGRRRGALTFEHPESPLRLHVYDEGDVLSVALLGFNERVKPASVFDEQTAATEHGGRGYSTALYLRALEEAQREGKGFSSDKIRTDATERMYERLRGLGVPFKLDEVADRWKVAADALAKVDLDVAWRTLLAETEIKQLREGVLMQRGASTPRGFLQFDAARSFFRVSLTGNANLSTFLHESGHAFLEILRKAAEQQDAPADVKADLASLERWLAVPIGGVWTEAQLERFARGFEAYLREGKAPSSELAGVFRAFKAWLTWIYRTMRGLDVELTDEVRGVMDRMLATEAEVEQARRDAQLLPAFESAEAAGMSEAQFQAYRERFERGAQVARERLERESLLALDRTMGEERARARADVEQLARLHPVFNLREFFRTGERLDGQVVPEEIKGLKLDRGSLEGLTDARGKRRLQFFAVEEGGVDPDILAPYFGFRDGAELVRELAETPRREIWVKAEVQRRLEERYPESTVGMIRARAMEAVHGQEDFVKALRDELDAVGRKIGAPPARSALDVLRLGARERVRSMTDPEMRADRYRRTGVTASRDFMEAIAAKKWVEAHDAKRRQLWNEFLARETTKARAEIEKIREHLRSFEDVGKRQRIGRVGGNFLAAIDEILDGIGFRRESLRAVRRRQRLGEYVAKMEEEGGVVTPELKELADLKSYREMTLDELRTVNAAVSNLEALARLKGKLLIGKERRDLARTAHEAAEHIRANVGREKGPTPGEKPLSEKVRSWARRGDASMKKVEFLVRELDGGKTAGFFHSLLFQPLVLAQTARYDLQGQVLDALMAPFRALDGERRRRYRQKVGFLYSPKMGKMVRLSRRNVLSVVLNMGNEGNRERLLKGYGWTEEQVRGRLAQLLDQGDIEIVEHVWKTVDSLWPAIRDLYERHAGLAPKRVEARPFTLVLADGTEAKLSGGYYPIAKAADLSDIGRQLAELEEATSLWTANFFAPIVEHGFTESRGKDMSPLELSLDVVPRHLEKVVHYLTHYEAIRSADRLLQVPELRQAITEGVGREYLVELRPWLEAIAADGVMPDPVNWWSRLLRHLRFGATVVLLFAKPATGVKQALGLFISAKEIKRRHMVSGLRQFLRGGWKEYLAESGEGKHLDKQLDRDARELFDSLQSRMSDLGRAKAQIIEWGALPIMLVQKAVNAITWYAAREQALEEGHADPKVYADSVVRLTQTAGGVKDLAAIQRGGETFKMLTVFFSYRQILYNLLAEKTGKTGWAKTREIFARTWFLLLLPVVVEHLLMAGVKDKEDPEDVAKRLALELALLPTSTVPILGDAAEMALSGRDMKAAPWLVSLGRGLEAGVDVATGEGNVKDARAIAELVGVTMHLPTAGLWNAGEWAVRLADGDLEEPGRDLLFRSPSQWE